MSAEGWLAVRYRDFYDVPRLVAVEYRGRVYLLNSPFDEEIDEYADHYTIHRLHDRAVAQLDAPSWEGVASAGEVVGRVPVNEVEFDETKRQWLNGSVFARLGIQ